VALPPSLAFFSHCPPSYPFYCSRTLLLDAICIAFSNAVGWSHVPSMKEDPVFAAELRMLTDLNPAKLNA